MTSSFLLLTIHGEAVEMVMTDHNETNSGKG